MPKFLIKHPGDVFVKTEIKTAEDYRYCSEYCNHRTVRSNADYCDLFNAELVLSVVLPPMHITCIECRTSVESIE
jgi:hypothetical protein